MAHLRTRRLVASFVAATVMAASATVAQAQVPPPSCPPPATVVPVGASERLQFLGPDSNDRSDRTSEASPREIPEFATLTIVNAGGSSLVIRIDAGGPQARRMQVGGAAAGAPQSCATVPQNGTWQITAADLRRIAAPEDLVIIRATDAAGAPAAPAGYIGLASDLTADETAAQTLQRRQTDVAQAAIVDKAAAAKPPAQAAAPAAPATPALPIEIGTGPPAGTTDPQRPFAVTEHAIALTNSNAVARRVALLDDAGATARSIDVAGQTSAAPILLDEASRLAGDDRILPFRVTDPAGTDLGTGFLSLPQRVLSGRVVVPLEVTGIGDWRFLNPRAAHTITTTTTLVFVPRVPGRTITLSFPSIDRALEPEFTQAGFVVKCDRPKTCVPVLEVQTTQREVAGRLLIRGYASGEGLVEFRMAFFEEDIEPANASGFVRVSPTQFEPPFSTTWNATAFAAVVRDAYFEGFRQDPAKGAVITADLPFNDQSRWHLAGNVRMVAKLQMGTRASGEVELLVKDKDFGVAEAPAVTTQKARLNVFGVNSFVLSIGRFDFAAPTRALAINESGEGFMTRWRALTVSHIIRPRDAYDIAPPAPKAEAGAPPVIAAQPDAGDRWSTLIQAQHGYRSLRAEGSVVIGRRKTYAGGDGYYRTFGGDLLAAGGFSRSSSETKEPAAIWRGSVGAYRSHRSADASDVDSPDNDEGWALLGDASLGLLKGKKPRLTIGGTWARSSADRPETTADESYVGESAAFAPDKIFLSNLATKIADPRVPLPAGDQNPARLLRRGIAGKNYYGAGCILHDLSPIYGILRLAQVPGTDIGLTSTTVRFHRYTLREGVPAADASARPQTGLGKEVLIEFLAESPRGVRYQITTAAFFPEPLLKTHNLVTGYTWLLDARVTIALK